MTLSYSARGLVVVRCVGSIGRKKSLNGRKGDFISEREYIVVLIIRMVTTADGADVRLSGMLHSARLRVEGLW